MVTFNSSGDVFVCCVELDKILDLSESTIWDFQDRTDWSLHSGTKSSQIPLDRRWWSHQIVRLLIIAVSFQRPSSRLHIYLLICRTMLTRKWNSPQSLGCAFLLASLILPPPMSSIVSFFCFFIFKFEASPEDFVNGLTSQLSLKQCGLGPPFLLFVYRGESTAPKGQLGPLALGRTRQVAPNFFTLVWWKPWWFFFFLLKVLEIVIHESN